MLTKSTRRDIWWTVFGAVVCALALHDLLGAAGKWTAAWVIASGWLP